MYGRDGFHVLMICTANLCRSPIAEAVMRDALAKAGMSWTVSSAGVAARVGSPMTPHAATVLAERGIEVHDWTSRRVTREMVERADLVLTTEVGHRAAVVSLVPAATRRTFPLLQFARFAAHADLANDPRSNATDLIDRVVAARGNLQPAPAGADDVADPIGKSIRNYRECADTINRAVEQIVRAVRERPAIRREASP